MRFCAMRVRVRPRVTLSNQDPQWITQSRTVGNPPHASFFAVAQSVTYSSASVLPVLPRYHVSPRNGATAIVTGVWLLASVVLGALYPSPRARTPLEAFGPGPEPCSPRREVFLPGPLDRADVLGAGRGRFTSSWPEVLTNQMATMT